MANWLIRKYLCKPPNLYMSMLDRSIYDDEGRTWSYTDASQGMPEVSSKPPKARKGQGPLNPLQMSGGVWP